MFLRSIRLSSVIIRIRNIAANKFCWVQSFFSLWSTLFSIIDPYRPFISCLHFKCWHKRTVPWWSPLPHCVLSQSLSLVWRHVVISSGGHLCDSKKLLMTCLQSRFSSAILGLSPVLLSLFFCSIYSHLTLCFRKCLQVSIPDIPGTWRADLMPMLQDEKQKNFVEPIKRMTFPWPWAVLFKIEAFAARGSLICELKSIISWPLLNHKSSLPLPSSFYLKGKRGCFIL